MFSLSIRSKITVFYIILTFASLLILTLIFKAILISSLEANTKENLIKDIDGITKFVDSSTSVIFDPADLYYDVLAQLQGEKYQPGLNAYRDRTLVFFDNDYKLVNTIYLVLRPGESEYLKQLIPSLIEASLKTTTYTIRKFNMNDINYMGVFVKTRDFYMLLYTSIGPLQLLINQSTLGMFIMMLLTMILAVGAGIVISRSIVKPINIIKETTNEIAKRNFDARVDVKWKKELGELGTSINKLASDLNEYDISQKKFLQNASHELKTPLMSIRGYAEGLKDGVFDNPDTALDVIIEESTRLNKIVEKLIYLTKLETIEDFFVYDIESINKIIKSCIIKIGSIAMKSNIRIIFEPVNDIYVCIDIDQISQAVINILSNCIRYAKKQIVVATSISASKVSIIITDDGDGFSENDMKNLFKRFYKGKKGVTGLGLAITKAILERHSGTIEIQNSPKVGAKFILQVPIRHI